jgi:hypothetical protein
MLRVAEVNETAIDIYTKQHLSLILFKTTDYLLPEDWTRLRTIKTFLQPTFQAKMATQGDYATIDGVLFTMDTYLVAAVT